MSVMVNFLAKAKLTTAIHKKWIGGTSDKFSVCHAIKQCQYLRDNYILNNNNIIVNTYIVFPSAPEVGTPEALYRDDKSM